MHLPGQLLQVGDGRFVQAQFARTMEIKALAQHQADHMTGDATHAAPGEQSVRIPAEKEFRQQSGTLQDDLGVAQPAHRNGQATVELQQAALHLGALERIGRKQGRRRRILHGEIVQDRGGIHHEAVVGRIVYGRHGMRGQPIRQRLHAQRFLAEGVDADRLPRQPHVIEREPDLFAVVRPVQFVKSDHGGIHGAIANVRKADAGLSAVAMAHQSPDAVGDAVTPTTLDDREADRRYSQRP